MFVSYKKGRYFLARLVSLSRRARNGVYFNTLVNERKHRDAKTIANGLPVTPGFDLSVNRRLLAHQTQGLIESGDQCQGEYLQGEQTDVTDQLGPVLRSHLAAAHVIASSEGLPCIN